MMSPEKYEKQKVKAYLKGIGAWYFCPYMAGRGASGVPDIIACINGTCWGIEVKRPGKGPTRLQEVMLTQLNASGACTAVGTAEVVIGAIEGWLAMRGHKRLPVRQHNPSSVGALDVLS